MWVSRSKLFGSAENYHNDWFKSTHVNEKFTAKKDDSIFKKMFDFKTKFKKFQLYLRMFNVVFKHGEKFLKLSPFLIWSLFHSQFFVNVYREWFDSYKAENGKFRKLYKRNRSRMHFINHMWMAVAQMEPTHSNVDFISTFLFI